MSLKIGIIGDVHLGANQWAGKQHPVLNINTRLMDYAETLDLTIDEMIAAGVNEIVFTGDIFEHRYPSIVQQKVFSQSLHRATSRGIERIHIVIGNHDQQRINSTTTISYLKELNLPNIRVYDEISMIPLVGFDKEVANLVFMPYRDRLWLDVETTEEAVAAIQQQLDSVMAGRNTSVPTILVGHMAIEGTFVEDSYKDLYGENQLSLPKDMFEGINLVIMGHIHKPEVISQDPYIAYVGSMEKRGGFENHHKVYAIIDLPTQSVEFFNEPCRDMWDLVLDHTDCVVGEELMDVISSQIEVFGQTNRLAGSIVRPTIKICAEDEQYLDAKGIQSMLKERHSVHFCTEVKPEIMTVRQSRDGRITEDVSHARALQMFLESTVEDVAVRKMLIEAGNDIVKSIGEGNNAAH